MTRILVVEDDLDQLNLRRQMLEQAGYEVAAAQTAAEALPQLPGCQLVLMDLRVPKLQDGMALIRAASGRARIIVLSGAESEVALPVDEFLTKPCSSRRLLEAIARLCSGPAAGA
ncbi:MAG TPA: response regulator [Bryobacteraceae bacterium]|nr:response regulator [Bryobacteraceae bacterium]